ncbi:MAG: hypothetical protein HY870_05460 [Chloroflexi bacterium]|nr:hypothetical protein [Chloroflexota bacterium]
MESFDPTQPGRQERAAATGSLNLLPREGNAPQESERFYNMTSEELRDAFQLAAAGTRKQQSDFFNRFKYVHDILHGNPGAGVKQGSYLLNECLKIDPVAYRDIHKGDAFYWLGIGSFLVHDVEIGTFFFDAAVSEDLHAHADPDSDSTPAFRFILLQGEEPKQAAQELVQQAQARVQDLIDNYNTRSGAKNTPTPFSIADLRRRFLRRAVQANGEKWRSLVTAFISFILEWDYRNALFDLRPGGGTAEPFFLHLFKGCVLFESLLKTNPSSDIQDKEAPLARVINCLYSQLDFRAPLNFDPKRAKLPDVVTALASIDESVQTAFQYTEKVRNTIGHNLSWDVEIDKITYSRIFRMISSACLHTIATLYK